MQRTTCEVRASIFSVGVLYAKRNTEHLNLCEFRKMANEQLILDSNVAKNSKNPLKWKEDSITKEQNKRKRKDKYEIQMDGNDGSFGTV